MRGIEILGSSYTRNWITPILEYRGHVQEAIREDTRGTLVVYAGALLPYAEMMESVAALPERSSRKQMAHYPDPLQHSEYELERPRVLGEYVAVRAELDTRVQHLRERILEQGRLLSPAEAEEYLQWRRNKYPPEARRSTFPSPEVLEPLSEWLIEEFDGYWDHERVLVAIRPIPRWPTTTNAYFTGISLEPPRAWCVPTARSKDRNLMKEHKNLGKGSRRPCLLKERGKPTWGESTNIPLLVPHPRNFIEEDRD